MLLQRVVRHQNSRGTVCMADSAAFNQRLSTPLRLFIGLTVIGLILTACSVDSSSSGTPPPPSTSVAAPQGLSGKLLYTRDNGLWSLDLATSKTAELVPAPDIGQVTGARWSADGSQLAYSLYEVKDRRTPIGEIYVSNNDGSNARKILSADQAAMFYQQPVWGADGKQLYYMYTFSSATERTRRIERFDVGSGERTTVLDEVGPFDVSPDGKWMAFIRTNIGDMSLVLIDLTTGQQRDLVPIRKFDLISAPRFDPSSQTVAFSAAKGTLASNPAPGDLRSMLASAFLPAVAQAHGYPQDVWTVPVSGGEVKHLLPLEADEPVPAWSPDGSRFIILSFEALFSVPVAGGQPSQIMKPGAYGTVDWAK